MKVYLSGKMSGLEADIWRTRFAECAAILMWEDYEVENPANTIIARHPWLYRIVGYRLTLWYDLRLLRRCDAIYMVCDDWRDSRGARLERMKAHQWGIKEIKLIDV